jgi:mannose-6-phosphate isomerase-like protein (cupin superfamily)
MSPVRRVSSLAGILIVLAAAVLLRGQTRVSAPVVGITHDEVQNVLAYSGSEGAGTDRQIRVADAGGYQIGVGVLHRGPTRPGGPVGAISHSQVTEVFYFLSGSGVLVTGGQVENERAFPPETEFVRLAVGPSNGGTFNGGDRRKVGPGDIVVVPAGVPHGFDDITDHLDYLSVRPDTTKTLPAGYVHPALRR